MKPPRVLLVDDEPDVRQTYSDLLREDGYEVDTAVNGEEAIEKAGSDRPDAILLDVMLPDKDGIEVAEELSMQEETSEIPIIMITALSSLPDGYGPEAVQGVHRFLYKPCRPRTLLEGIGDVVRRGY